MAKKRKTLPKNFDELIQAGDLAALKAVFDGCEISAYDHGFNKKPALGYNNIPDELVRWLVSQGADIDQRDHYGKTPLFHQAGNEGANLALFLELGASLEPTRYHSPLYRACTSLQPQNVRTLIAHGANLESTDELHKRTPLGAVLFAAFYDITRAVEIVEILLANGAKIMPGMADTVKRIGKEFEFRRPAYEKESMEKTEAGLAKLYTLFSVQPVEKLRRHDGVSPITVIKTSWQSQHNELWDYLVPPSGKAATVQGEVIRITGRVSDELYRNGGANWNADYRKMLHALLEMFSSGTALSAEELGEAETLASGMRAKGGNELKAAKRLCELAVRWVLNNPNPVSLGKTDYKR